MLNDEILFKSPELPLLIADDRHIAGERYHLDRSFHDPLEIPQCVADVGHMAVLLIRPLHYCSDFSFHGFLLHNLRFYRSNSSVYPSLWFRGISYPLN